jgi:hypothetical protein
LSCLQPHLAGLFSVRRASVVQFLGGLQRRLQLARRRLARIRRRRMVRGAGPEMRWRWRRLCACLRAAGKRRAFVPSACRWC